jgi:hypothetical protein
MSALLNYGFSGSTPLAGFGRISRRDVLKAGCGFSGLSLPEALQLQTTAAEQKLSGAGPGRAKSCIVLYCWGGMSHIDTFDPKPEAPENVRGLFKPIATATPGIQFSEYIPRLAKQSEHLAVIRSMHHNSSAHGKGMYWNSTGHPPPQAAAAVNLPPSRDDWPSLAAMVSKFRKASTSMPPSIRLPYPLVDNGTLQAGESGGWMGQTYDPIVVRTPGGKEFDGVSRDLGSPVLDFSKGMDATRLQFRGRLLKKIEQPVGRSIPVNSYEHFHELALEMLVNPKVREAFDLKREPQRVHDAYGNHICGQSVLLSRRLVEAGVPIVSVVCAAGDLNGSKGDHWDTHGDNFNRLKNTMLPVFDRAASALLKDLAQRGRLDETLVVMMGDFGRTPKINGGAGRDHYPYCFSVALAGGGIRGGQVYGSSDSIAAYPHNLPCGPNALHATIFQSLGIPLDAELFDRLNRPQRLTDGQPLPLF